MPAFKSHTTATVDTSWDGPGNKTNAKIGENRAYYGKIFAWYDPDMPEDQKGTYKFIHHEVAADGTPGAANTVGCSTGIGVLNGGMGGTTIPEADRQGVYDHLAKHIIDAGKEAPPLDMANRFKGYSVRAQVQDAEIWLYDEIGSGWFGGVSAKQFADDLKALGKVSTINVRINSPGGDVFDGIAIYNVLKSHQAKVIVHIDGLAASIASIIAMAGDEIYMAGNATMMIHKAWGMTVGNSEDMQSMADTLAKLDGTLTGTYAKRTGIDWGKISDMMTEETWMNSHDALALGFIDQITEEMKLAAHFDLDKFKFKKNQPADSGPMIPNNADEDKPGPMPPDVSCFDVGISRCEAILKERF
jgi:ATP-dependent Clp protease, protease subunit